MERSQRLLEALVWCWYTCTPENLNLRGSPMNPTTFDNIVNAVFNTSLGLVGLSLVTLTNTQACVGGPSCFIDTADTNESLEQSCQARLDADSSVTCSCIDIETCEHGNLLFYRAGAREFDTRAEAADAACIYSGVLNPL